MTAATPHPPGPAPSFGPSFEPSASRRRRPFRGGAARAVLVVATALVALMALACSSPADDDAGGAAAVGPALSIPADGRFPDGTTVRLLAHDAFAVSEAVLDQFTQATNVQVEIVLGGDAVTMVNQAVLTAGSPQADVLFGVDDNLLSRAGAAELFVPRPAAEVAAVPPAFRVDAALGVTPISYGDVCVNYDRTWFAERGLAPPTTFEALADPAYRDLLVVQDPSASTPGLAFLLGTIARFGGGSVDDDGAAWVQYWERLQANGVKVVDSWEIAYSTEFSGSAGAGPRPLVVSYATSPPAEVTDPSVAPDASPTGVVTDTCVRQVEYAGVLRGAEQPAAGQALIDFMLTVPFQEDVPGQMYVYPVNPEASLPEVFARFSPPVPSPLTLPAAEVGAERDRWVQQWSALFR